LHSNFSRSTSRKKTKFWNPPKISPVTHPAQAGCAPSLPRLAITRSFREDVADLGVGQNNITMKATPSEVLYYPSIEFYDDTWLKGALCHWDKIYRIVPPSYVPRDSDEVKEAADAGLLESIILSEFDLSDTADNFVRFWDETAFVPAGFEGYEEEPIRLHPEKVDERIREQLAALSERIDQDGFLSLSRQVANSYMLFLSEVVSRRRCIPKLTDDADTRRAFAATDSNLRLPPGRL